MKKLLLLLTLFLADLCSAQTPQSVLGINLKITMKNFKSEMVKKGYKPSQTAEGVYEYKISYAGYNDCRMEVKYNIGNDSIRLVTIYFPHESYAKDASIFNNMTKQFKEKYGNEFNWNEPLGFPLKDGLKSYSYGKHGVNMCWVVWYFDDEEEDDGVHVQYDTSVKLDEKVSISSDI